MNWATMLSVASAEEWRDWLATHHGDRDEVWLVFYRKDTAKQIVSYEESVEEAICFGWIDGKLRKLDEERYAIRFAPRRRNSNWSDSNRARALKMMRRGKMTASGLDTLPAELLSWGSAEQES